MDKTLTIELKHPIEAHGESISTLTLEEPTLGALEGLEIVIDKKGNKRFDLGQLIKPISTMAGIPLSSAKKIKVSDIIENAEGLLDFLDLSLLTGDE